MRKTRAAMLALSVLGIVPCTGVGLMAMAGCSYSHTVAGVTNVRAEVAGTEEGKAALSAKLEMTDYSLKIKGDPLAFGNRVVQDLGSFVRGIFAQFSNLRRTPAPALAPVSTDAKLNDGVDGTS